MRCVMVLFAAKSYLRRSSYQAARSQLSASWGEEEEEEEEGIRPPLPVRDQRLCTLTDMARYSFHTTRIPSRAAAGLSE